MGLLLNQAYWAAQIKKLVNCRPSPPARTMSAPQTAQYLTTLCASFSDLSKDLELTSDIQKAFAVMGSGRNHPPEGTPSFEAFIEVYERAEMQWLTQCSIDMDSAADVIEAVRGTYFHRYDFSEGPDRIVGRIKAAARVCCDEAIQHAAEQEKLVRAKEMRGVFSGAVILSIDIAPPAISAAVGMPWLSAALGPIAGFSAKSGLQAVVDGTKRWFSWL
jgi:hypothetical protein